MNKGMIYFLTKIHYLARVDMNRACFLLFFSPSHIYTAMQYQGYLILQTYHFHQVPMLDGKQMYHIMANLKLQPYLSYFVHSYECFQQYTKPLKVHQYYDKQNLLFYILSFVYHHATAVQQV